MAALRDLLQSSARVGPALEQHDILVVTLVLTTEAVCRSGRRQEPRRSLSYVSCCRPAKRKLTLCELPWSVCWQRLGHRPQLLLASR